jgi:hypothetical protein
MPIDISKYGVGLKYATAPTSPNPTEDREIGLLERGYNSIFPLQQLLLRALRAAKDEDIDLFSREGILAPELIPVLGLFASHETDARTTDVFGDQGLIGNFALEMATDPFSYFAAPLTALAKGHRATQLLKSTNRTGKAFRNSFAKQGVSPDQFKTVGELKKAVDAAEVTSKQRGKISKLLHGIDDTQDLAELTDHANKIDLMVRLPFLREMTKNSEALQSHGSWWNWMNKSKASPVAWPRLAAAPVLRALTGTAAGEKISSTVEAFKEGMKAVRPRFVQAGIEGEEKVFSAARALAGHEDVVDNLARIKTRLEKVQVDVPLEKALSGLPKGTQKYLNDLGLEGTQKLVAELEEAQSVVKNIDRQMVKTGPPEKFNTVSVEGVDLVELPTPTKSFESLGAFTQIPDSEGAKRFAAGVQKFYEAGVFTSGQVHVLDLALKGSDFKRVGRIAQFNAPKTLGTAETGSGVQAHISGETHLWYGTGGTVDKVGSWARVSMPRTVPKGQSHIAPFRAFLHELGHVASQSAMDASSMGAFESVMGSIKKSGGDAALEKFIRKEFGVTDTITLEHIASNPAEFAAESMAAFLLKRGSAEAKKHGIYDAISTAWGKVITWLAEKMRGSSPSGDTTDVLDTINGLLLGLEPKSRRHKSNERLLSALVDKVTFGKDTPGASKLAVKSLPFQMTPDEAVTRVYRLGGAGSSLQKTAWAAGQSLRKQLNLTFGSGTEITSDTIKLLQNERDHHRALTFSYLQKSQDEATEALKGLAGETGIPAENLNRVFVAYAEMTPYAQDWQNSIRNFQEGRISSERAIKDFDVYLSHMESSLKTIEDVSGVSGLPRIRAAVNKGLMANHEYASVRIGSRGFNQTSPMWASTKERYAVDLSVEELDGLIAATTKGATKTRETLSRIRDHKKQGLIPDKGRSALAVGGDVTQPGFLDSAEHAYATLLEARQYIDRSRKAKHIDPAHYGDLVTQAQTEIRAMTDDVMREVFGDSENWGRIRSLHDEAVSTAHLGGGLAFGGPLTYLPRRKIGVVARAIKSVLGKDLMSDLPQDLRASNLFARDKHQKLSLEDLNEFIQHKHFDTLEPTTQQAIKDVLKKHNIDTSKGIKFLEEDFIDLTLTRIGGDMERHIYSDMVNGLLADTEVAFQHGLRGGKVIKTFKQTAGETPMPPREVGKLKKGQQTVKTETSALPNVEEWALVERADGSQDLINITEQHRNGSVFDLRGAGGVESIGDAFTLTAWNNNAQKSIASVDSLKPGSYVIAGDAATLSWLKNATAPQPEQMRAFLEAYDGVNWFFKRFQTVLRPGHVVSNRLSGFGQSQAAGASLASTIFAEMDIQRMFGRYVKGDAEHLDRTIELARRSSGTVGRLSKNFLGHKAMLAIVEMSTGKTAKEVVESVGSLGKIEVPNGDYDLLDVIQLAVKEGVFTGQFVAQDLRIGGESLMEMRRKLGNTGWKKKLEDLTDLASGSETAARLQTLIALTYDGLDPATAIARTKGAHVDYSMLTPRERSGLKRLIPYYTFARRFTPWAIERLKADGPGKPIQMVIQGMRADKEGQYLYQDEFGTTRMRMPFGTTQKVPRVIPQLETFSAVLGIAQMLDPWNTDKIRADVPFLEVAGGGGAGFLKESVFGRRGNEGMSVRNTASSFSRTFWPVRLAHKAVTGVDDDDGLMESLFKASISPATGLQLDRSASLQAVASEIQANPDLSADDKAELLSGIYAEISASEQTAKTRR